MPNPLFTIQGKAAVLDVYKYYAVARNDERESRIDFARVASVELVEAEPVEASYILFVMQSGKKITFAITPNLASFEEAKSHVDEIRRLADVYNSSLKITATPVASSSTTSCPKCLSKNVQPLGVNRKSFSVGKAIGGAVLTGGIGALAGFIGKKNGYDMYCLDCGNRFPVK